MTLTQRRSQTVVSSLHLLKGETLEDLPESKRNKHMKEVEVLEKALSKRSLKDSLEALRPLIEEPLDEKNTKNTKKKGARLSLFQS